MSNDSWLEGLSADLASDKSDLPDARRQASSASLDGALGIKTRRVAAGRPATAQFADGSLRTGLVEAVSADGSTCRLRFMDGGADWFPTARVSAADHSRLAEAQIERELGEAIDETPIGVNRVAIYGAEPPVPLWGRYDEPGVLENEGAMGTGESREPPRGNHPERARAEADADFQAESEEIARSEKPPSLTASNDARLQQASKEIYDMVMDSWAERGREAGVGTCDRVASVFFGSTRQAQWLGKIFPGQRQWADEDVAKITGDADSSGGKMADEDLVSTLAMSKNMPSEAPIVHKLIVDYLADNPSELDSLAPGAYMKALNGAVDYWRRVNPAKLERVRKQVAPDMAEPVAEADIQAGPNSWWDQVKMAVSPMSRAMKDAETTPPGPGAIRGQPATPQQSAPAPSLAKPQTPQTPQVASQAGSDTWWGQAKEDATAPGPDFSARPPIPHSPDRFNEDPTWEGGVGTMIEGGQPTRKPPRGRTIPDVSDLTLDPDFHAPTYPGPHRVQTTPPSKRAPGQPRRVMRATPELAKAIGEAITRIAVKRDKNGVLPPERGWDIRVRNAASTNHWLMVDVTWPKDGCPVDPSAPGGMANLSYLLKGRLQGWMQNQRNLGIFAEPQLLSLDVEKREARLSVAVIGATSYPQAVVEGKFPALKEESND